jgi:hypothetical protein
VYGRWLSACSFRDRPLPLTASFDVLRQGSIRRLSELIASSALYGDSDQGSLRWLLRFLGILQCSTIGKRTLLELATPSVLDSAASTLNLCTPSLFPDRHAVRLCPSLTSSYPYKSFIAFHPRSQSGKCEWAERKYLAGTMGSAGAGLLREIWHDQGVMRYVLGVALPSPASSLTVLLSARSECSRTLRSCIMVCLPSLPPSFYHSMLALIDPRHD